MKRLRYFTFMFLLLSCGGGGGGSDSGNSSGNSEGVGAAKGVRVFHASTVAAPVDFFSSAGAGAVKENIRFSFVSARSGLAEGAQILSLIRTRVGGDTYANVNANIEKDKTYTLLLSGNGESFDVRGNLIDDNRPAVSSQGNSLIRVVHGVISADAINLSSDVGSHGSTRFGSASSYVEIPAGARVISANRATDGRQIFSQAVELSGGKAYSLYLSGDVTGAVVGRFLQD